MSFDSLIGGVGVLILARRRQGKLSVLAEGEEAQLFGMLSADLGWIARCSIEEERERTKGVLVERQGH